MFKGCNSQYQSKTNTQLTQHQSHTCTQVKQTKRDSNHFNRLQSQHTITYTYRRNNTTRFAKSRSTTPRHTLYHKTNHNNNHQHQSHTSTYQQPSQEINTTSSNTQDTYKAMPRRKITKQRRNLTRYKGPTKMSTNIHQKQTTHRNYKQNSIQYQTQSHTSIHNQSIHLQHQNTKGRVQHSNQKTQKVILNNPTTQGHRNSRPPSTQQAIHPRTRQKNTTNKTTTRPRYSQRRKQLPLSQESSRRRKPFIQKTSTRVQGRLQHRSASQPHPSTKNQLRPQRSPRFKQHQFNTTPITSNLKFRLCTRQERQGSHRAVAGLWA